MRIVYVVPQLPRPWGGTAGRLTAALLPALVAEGVDVTCVCGHEESESAVAEAAEHAAAGGYEFVPVRVRLQESRFHRWYAGVRRPRSEYARCEALISSVEHAMHGGYDVLHLDDLFLAWGFRTTPRRVVYLLNLDVVDWEGRSDLTPMQRVHGSQVRRGTRALLRREPRVIAMTARIASELPRWGYGGEAPVVGPAFDATPYHAELTDDRIVGVIGSMFWYPSRAAAERVLGTLWPAIRARVADARLLVAGHESGRYLGRYFPLPGAELLGAVEDPAQLFGSVAVLLYPPPRGTGVKVKVLESLAYGVPVVTNAEGLEGFPEHTPVIRAETDEQFIAKTVQLLEDPALRHELRSSGRRLLSEVFEPEVAARGMLAAYERLGLFVSPRRPGGVAESPARPGPHAVGGRA